MTQDTHTTRTGIGSFLHTVVKGICVGTADIVPGVSGGTVALILGFYGRLVEAILAFDGTLLLQLSRGKFRAAVQHTDSGFLLPLGIGIAAALMFFTHVVSLPALIRIWPTLIYGLFFGLVAASAGVLLRELGGIGWRETGWFALGVLAGYQLVAIVPMETPDGPWFIFMSGALAICAMILPGISGAFVLLILKKYTYLLDAFGRFDLGVLAPFILGAIVGLMLFSRFLGWLLQRFHRQMFLVITGILTGSLWILWPFREYVWQNVGGGINLVGSIPMWPKEFDGMTMAALGLGAAGAAVVMIIHGLAGRIGDRPMG